MHFLKTNFYLKTLQFSGQNLINLVFIGTNIHISNSLNLSDMFQPTMNQRSWFNYKHGFKVSYFNSVPDDYSTCLESLEKNTWRVTTRSPLVVSSVYYSASGIRVKSDIIKLFNCGGVLGRSLFLVPLPRSCFDTHAGGCW